MVWTSGLYQIFCHFCAVVLVISSMTALCQAYNEYCIIGAGPSGLQMGYFFERAGRDYVIFEKSNVSGSFYVDYPRHRKLISINKGWTGKTNKEYNLRHDWNSLLSDDEDLKFTKYSDEMFPPADLILKYFDDYKNKFGLNVVFNTEISNINKKSCWKEPDGHFYTMNDQHGKNYKCGRLILATGLATPNIPDIPGIEYADGYEDMSINRSDYKGKNVLIIGRGNSAFETATHIYGVTNFIHVAGRSTVRLSWATHYVGDLRAVNNELIDTYQLKSLDGILALDGDNTILTKSAEDGKFYIKPRHVDPNNNHLFDNSPVRDAYDKIIRCTGFTFDKSIFNESMIVSSPTGRISKYISIYSNYESIDHMGMFVAGTASHSLDFRKSAGAFIHGYRYTAQVLFRLLERRYHGVKWPAITAPNHQLLSHLLKRINEASGIYQMFSNLIDVVILNKQKDTFTYIEEYPIKLIPHIPKMTGHPADSIIVLNLQYGAGFSDPAVDIFSPDLTTIDPALGHQSDFLHPVLYYFEHLPTEARMWTTPKGEQLPRPELLHHIVEDFTTMWNAPIGHILPLRRFLEVSLDTDLRSQFAESCMLIGLTDTKMPITCKHLYMNGQGITPFDK